MIYANIGLSLLSYLHHPPQVFNIKSENVTYVNSTPSNKNKQKMKISAVSRVRSNHRHPVWSFYKSAAIFHQKNNHFNVKIEKFSAICCDRNYHQQSRWALLTKLYWLFSPKNIFKLNGVSSSAAAVTLCRVISYAAAATLCRVISSHA